MNHTIFCFLRRVIPRLARPRPRRANEAGYVAASDKDRRASSDRDEMPSVFSAPLACRGHGSGFGDRVRRSVAHLGGTT